MVKLLSTQGTISVRVLIDPADCDQSQQSDHMSMSYATAKAIGLEITNITAEDVSGDADVSVTYFENHGWVIHSGFMRESDDAAGDPGSDGFLRQTFIDRDGAAYQLKVPAGPSAAQFDLCVDARDALGNRYAGKRRCETTPGSSDRSIQVWVSRQ